jgi:hypothetical protein
MHIVVLSFIIWAVLYKHPDLIVKPITYVFAALAITVLLIRDILTLRLFFRKVKKS